MFEDFKPETKVFLIVVLIAVVVSVGGILLLKAMQPTPIEQQVFVSQEECEGKTGKQCFLFRGLCQVMVAQNAAEEEENERFLNDCQKKIGTWQPTEERLQVDIPISAPSEVEGWQTYRSDEFGFEVKYPKSWLLVFEEKDFVGIASVPLTEYLHGVGEFSKGSASIALWVTRPQYSFSEGISETEVHKSGSVVHNGRILVKSGKEIFIDSVYWKDDPQGKNFDATFDQIIATFRFVE